MATNLYRFGGLTFALDAPRHLPAGKAEPFRTQENTNPDYTYLIRPETGPISYDAPIRLEREGRVIRAYLDVEKLPGLSVSSFLCSVQTALLLPETGRFILHASYIVHEGQAILFTAPSQTGKSTQARFWQERCGARIVNEDRVIVSCEKGVYYAHGCWATGTAGVTDNVSAPLRCVVLLGQSPENRVTKPSAVEKLQRLVPQCTFDDGSAAGRVGIVDALTGLIVHVPVLAYSCRNHIDSVDELKRWI